VRSRLRQIVVAERLLEEHRQLAEQVDGILTRRRALLGT
jgi:hypothetical protein